MKRGVVLLLVLATGAAGCGDDRIVVAAGTTLVDSGFIERVLAEYPGDEQVSVVAGSSREALALGGAGSAQLLITHLPEAEAQFLADHPDAVQAPVFTSEFVLVGPSAERFDSPNVVEAFRQIAAGQRDFVSRGDGSGTAAKEGELWQLAGVDPAGEDWHTETGQGMGFTLQVADQLEAYTLAELGSYLATEQITLVPFVGGQDDERLANPYRLTLVGGSSPAARELFEWLASEPGRDAIDAANRALFEGQIYVPPEMQSS